jgi:predicted ATPase
LLRDKDERGAIGRRNVASYVYDAISSWKIYHFHDTSKLAPMRRSETIDDTDYLRFDAANIAPFLLDLKNNEKSAYKQIVETIRLAAPFFDNFILKPTGNDKVRLLWRQKGADYPLKPYHLSDGTIRFICLTTVLLQPDLPSTILIDEPELGLHPYAIEILAELIQAASQKTQLIVSTQSPALIDYFEPEDIIVINRKMGTSVFQRLNKGELSSWLKDYTLGELWRKNIVTGGPAHE